MRYRVLDFRKQRISPQRISPQRRGNRDAVGNGINNTNAALRVSPKTALAPQDCAVSLVENYPYLGIYLLRQ
ncbi:hypothetical protein BJP36_36680 [Moorena producens JHB]|uniref:Uncharacterized protein n=1 Tax=Moorena producens (strain JHB) TaxID=1454205 RepID=A0A9Q9UW95_MOOP1|nr:hypothetical protein [Moorena producens]WAN69633.1 hypothetical protein BJP36_36680 [Moorena producens JHB]